MSLVKRRYSYSILSFCKWCSHLFKIQLLTHLSDVTSEFSRILFSDVFRYKLCLWWLWRVRKCNDSSKMLLFSCIKWRWWRNDGRYNWATNSAMINWLHCVSYEISLFQVNNNRDGLFAIEIPRTIQTIVPHSREAKTQPMRGHVWACNPSTWYVFILLMLFEKSWIQWSKEESRATHSYTQTFHDDFAWEYNQYWTKIIYFL